jgi:hypothetical protein
MAASGVRPVKSAYLRQIERMVPPRLLDREAERAELTAFCLDADRGPYVWWRAGPYAGKTALLSKFVLDPPEQLRGQVWIVSFFITAHDTREDFASVVREQLCELMGRGLPDMGDEGARAAWVLKEVLAEAAAARRASGGRLVLVVDGLDEDRGVTCGADAHSIAGLLPVDPPAGMRIIVAGRPNPPTPDDVRAWHPLRDPGIIRELTASPHARELQRLARPELKRLLRGGRLAQDLLGLLTAARGGLAGLDLCQLTGASLVDVEDVLHTAAGRSFTRHPAVWAPHTGPELYLLGHEELYAAAYDYLGAVRLAEYQDQLHTWADGYGNPDEGGQRWPTTTPEYPLREYPDMLKATGDTDRLVALATDQVRHDRMRARSGSDTAALAEIRAAQDLILVQHEPDLHTLARLSVRRNALADRIRPLPSGLPAVWTALARPATDESFITGITNQLQPAHTFASLSRAVAAAGDLNQARRLAANAETTARAQTEPHWRALALAEVAHARAAAGDLKQAEALARAITDPFPQALALAAVAQVIAAGYVGRDERLAAEAEALARARPSTPFEATQRRDALIGLANATAATGELDRARRLVADAEALARDHTDPCWQAYYLADVAQVVAAIGEIDRARRLVADAEGLVRGATDSFKHQALAKVAQAATAVDDVERAQALGRITIGSTHSWQAQGPNVRAVRGGGDFDRAEALARAITDPRRQERALLEIAEVATSTGDLRRAETLARAITDPHFQARALAGIAQLVATAGDLGQAETLARAITDPHHQARALAGIAQLMAATGKVDHAGRLTADAEALAQASIDSDRRADKWIKAERLGRVAEVVAVAGDVDRAEALARAITDPRGRDRALAEVAKVATAAGHLNKAEALARGITDTDSHQQAQALRGVAQAVMAAGDVDRAVAVAGAITSPSWQAGALTDLVKAAAAAGNIDRAEAIARAVTVPHQRPPSKREFAVWGRRGEVESTDWIIARERAESLGTVAKAAATAGDVDRAEALARSITNPYWQPRVLVEVVQAAAAAGQVDRAETLARTLTDRDHRTLALFGVAQAIATARYANQAEQLAADGERLARAITDPFRRAWALAEVAKAAIAAGYADWAEQLAEDAEALTRAITDPYRRALALAGITQAVAAVGDVDWAETLARAITDPYCQALAFADVVRAVATADDIERAETLARAATDPDQQAHTLTGAAWAATATGDANRACRLLGDAFASGSWLLPLPVLAKLRPKLVLQLANEVSGHDRPVTDDGKG